MNRNDLYASITAQVVAQIEAGAGAWHMPWKAIADVGCAVNASTGAAYKGGNQMIFGMLAAARGWDTHYATYKQWSTLGAQVRKGEKATFGVKWSPVIDRATGEPRMIPVVFSVFSASQVDGWEIPTAAARDTLERVAAAETFFEACRADVRNGGNQAGYSPAGDFIVLPDLVAFSKVSDYYATSAHEHAHWTGHASRLDRTLSTKFGSDAYGAEELIAELSAAFTCAHLGISLAPRPDHAQYLASWLRTLRADTSALFTAASKAQSATDYLISLQSA